MSTKLHTLHSTRIKSTQNHSQLHKKSHKPTNSFKSKSQRFKIEIFNNNPGPGTYECLQNLQIFDKLQKHTNPLNHHQWILDTHSRSGFIPQNSNRNIGPGSYNLQSIKYKVKNSSWTRQDRFSHSNESIKQNVGPGSYEDTSDILTKNKNKGSSVFKSKTNKSYFQDLKQNSYPQQKLDQQPFINLNPQINQQRKSNIKKHKKQIQQHVFSSKIPRFQTGKSNVKLGPGSYEIDKQISHKPKLPKIITIQQKRTINIDKSKQKNVPGPGTYDNKQTLVKLLENKGSPAIFQKQQRFKDQQRQKSPGPGTYHPTKYMYMVDLSRNPPKSKVSFLSSSKRIQTILPTKDNPFGTYNLQLYNLDYKLKKKQQHLEKLKIMEVELPAFNTRSKK